MSRHHSEIDYAGSIDLAIELLASQIESHGHHLDLRRLRRSVDKALNQFTGNTVDAILKHKHQILAKSSSPESPTVLRGGIPILVGMLEDHTTGSFKFRSTRTPKTAAIALSYFLQPFDLIPDVARNVGLLDDAIYLLLCMKQMLADFKSYCSSKNLDMECLLHPTIRSLQS
jgi:uncharacterized membrane protein YkvA (DUF1232 family)